MIAFRFFSHFFQLSAFANIATGIWLWLAGHDLTRSAGDLWYELAPGSLNLSQVIVQRYLYPDIWEWLAVPLLLRPLWEALVGSFIVFLLLGGGVGFLNRQRR